LSEVARGVGEHVRLPHPAVSHALQLYLLRREQGRIEEIEDAVRRLAEENPQYPICRCALTQLLAQRGLDVQARSNLDAFAADRFAGLPFDETWLVSMGLLAETASALRDAGHAAALDELLAPYADRVAIAYSEISLGSVARHLGLLATLMERWGDAERHFATALGMNGKIGARSWEAHTQRDHARMLLARDAPGDAQRAETLLADALTTYRQLGMETYAASASQELDGVA